MNNHKLKSFDKIYAANQSYPDLIYNSKCDFIIPADPLVPIKQCTTCGYNKGFIVYTYKCWENYSKKLSHFGLIRCDQCGSAITWIPKEGRRLLIKKHNITL